MTEYPSRKRSQRPSIPATKKSPAKIGDFFDLRGCVCYRLQMKNRWKLLSQKFVHVNPWYSVRCDKVLRPEGKRGTYNVIVKPPAVFVVAVDEKDRVALIQLYRYPTQRYSMEIPAGGMEKETPLQAAKRELKEETGLVAKHWEKIGLVQIANGIMDQLGHVYLATDLSHGNATGHEEEGIDDVLFVPFKKIISLIVDGKITDSNSITPLLMAAVILKVLKS